MTGACDELETNAKAGCFSFSWQETYKTAKRRDSEKLSEVPQSSISRVTLLS